MHAAKLSIAALTLACAALAAGCNQPDEAEEAAGAEQSEEAIRLNNPKIDNFHFISQHPVTRGAHTYDDGSNGYRGAYTCRNIRYCRLGFDTSEAGTKYCRPVGNPSAQRQDDLYQSCLDENGCKKFDEACAQRFCAPEREACEEANIIPFLPLAPVAGPEFAPYTCWAEGTFEVPGKGGYTVRGSFIGRNLAQAKQKALADCAEGLPRFAQQYGGTVLSSCAAYGCY